ncbi:hypothetical protein PN36_06465 [Candidatus Thiomargarita nelsonii]|uniref:Peptidoglycan-associated lipoprotein n=1 Tax=Candidatus Thiomargarita nelsonii TaxID=1003181 RepID=A0A0A6PAW5_9GAMM|nr:hypothetical protein PN36_06465 [Candidatus Thiomargarita nelsonii]
MIKWRNLVLILVVLVLAGCATSSKNKGKQSVAKNKATSAPILGDTAMTQSVPCTNPPCDSYGTPIGSQQDQSSSRANDIPEKRNIYFSYDKNTIRPDAQIILEEHATYITNHPNAYVRLEGHTDERGSREYNLALAERRVEAAKEVLLILGVFENKLVTISYGEEQPVALEHNEEAWQLNRRVELIYP